MALFAKCCCCIELRIGVIIFGALTILFSIWELFQIATGLELVANKYFSDPEANDEDVVVNLSYIQAYYISSVVINVIMIVCLALTIFGATKRRRKFLIPYLVCEMVRTTVHLMYVIYLFTVLGLADDEAVIASFVFALSIYLWLCVYSLFQKYREEESRRGIVGGAAHQPGFHTAYTAAPVIPS